MFSFQRMNKIKFRLDVSVCLQHVLSKFMFNVPSGAQSSGNLVLNDSTWEMLIFTALLKYKNNNEHMYIFSFITYKGCESSL